MDQKAPEPDTVRIYVKASGAGVPEAKRTERTYRAVEAEHLGGDLFRIRTDRPENEDWEYPTGATVFAAKRLIEDDTIRLLAVAPFKPETWPAAAAPKPRTRAAARTLKLDPLLPARALIATDAVVMIVTLLAEWAPRTRRFAIEPADPLKLSVLAGCAILWTCLAAPRTPRDLQRLHVPLVITSVAFALSLILDSTLR